MYLVVISYILVRKKMIGKEKVFKKEEIEQRN
jgi:hypothetical protein